MENKINISKLKLLGFFVLLFSISVSSVYGQVLVPFEQIYPDLGAGEEPVVRGDMRIIGNSILGIEDNNFDGQSFEANDEYNGGQSNNRAERGYIDIDSAAPFNGVFSTALPPSETEYSDAVNSFGSPLNSPTTGTTGTFSSSSAQLSIRDANSELGPGGIVCAKVVKAFLYWGGIYPNESLTEGSRGADVIALERPDCAGCERYTDVKILPPNATEYIDIRATNSGQDYSLANSNTSLQSSVIFDGLAGGDNSIIPATDSSTKDVPYACVADVTSLFTHLQEEGTAIQGNWTVANVRATTGYRRNGSGGGWSLAVVYEDPLSSVQKNITFFQGFVNIETGNVPVDFNIAGFETIPAGPVNVDIATIGLEGDIGLDGDQFQIQNPNNINDFIPLSPPNLDAGNFYDSSITNVEVEGPLDRFPNSSNTLGYDSDHFTINNGPNGNDFITNSDNNADFRISTVGDSYTNFFNAFGIDVIAPDLQVIKRAFRADNSEFSETDEVDLGQEIVYEIVITNGGNDDAVNISFVDILPINTNFDNLEVFLGPNLIDSNLITSIPVVATDELTGLSFDTTQINFDIADELLEVGETVTITFSVNVVEDCMLLDDVCTNRIQNRVDVSYFGAVDIDNNVANPFLYQVQSAFDVNECEEPDFGPTVLLSDQSFCENQVRFENLCAESIALIGGDGFDEYQWFFEGSRLTTDANNNAIGPNDSTIIVGNTGDYRVEQLINTNSTFSSCRDVIINFTVTLFDPLAELNNPFVNLGEPLEPACSIDGTPIIGIQLCNDDIDIPTNFPDGTTLSWQRLDESAGCVQASQNCPFTGSQDCYEQISTDTTFTLSEEGSYLLTATLFGGCTFDYYFDAVPIGIEPILTATNPGCADEVVFTVEGIDFSDNIIDFELNFEITNNGAITNSSAEELVSGSDLFDTFRLPRVPGEGYSVRGIVTTNIEGLCTFFTDPIAVSFIDLNLTTEIVRQASCFEDNNTDNFDPTTADIRATVEDNDPNGPAAATIATPYIFNLIDRATGLPVDTSGVLNSNTHLFENVNPMNEYEIEVFAFGNQDAATLDNCSFTAPVEELEVPLEFDFVRNVIELTCEPAEIDLELDIPSELNEEDFTITIGGIVNIGNIITGDQTIFIDDVLNRPADVIDDDSLEIDNAEVRVINYIDFTQNTGGIITITLSSPEAGCFREQTVEITPFTPPTIAVGRFEDITCEGDDDGSITVTSTNAGPSPTYQLVLNGGVIETQMTPVFTGLAEGEYTVRVLREINNANNTVCTAEVIQTIAPAVDFTAPVIEAPEFFCDASTVAIGITTLVTGGTGDLTYDLLRDGEIFRIFVDTDGITTDDITLGDINTGTLLPGTYALRVTDENLCDVISNEVVIQELEITLSSNPVGVVPASCNVVTGTGEPAAEVTISATFSIASIETIASYIVDSSTDTSVVGVTGVGGVFILPAGTHTIEATSTNFGCTETIDVTVTPIDEIEALPVPSFVCTGETDGIITFNISNFTSDYQYTLESDAGNATSIAPRTSTSETINPLVLGALPAGDYNYTITDNVTGCLTTGSTTIIEQSVIIDPVDDIALECFGDTDILTINPTDGIITNNQYSFDGGTTFQDTNSTVVSVTTGTSEIINYVVRNIETRCTVGGEVEITQAAEILRVSSDDTDVICNPTDGTTTEGSVSFEISGGTPPYIYTLQSTTNGLINDEATIPATNSVTGSFPALDPGTYRVLVEDANSCFVNNNLLTFEIFPNANDGVIESFADPSTDCLEQVTLFFEVEEGTGSLIGDNFRIATSLDADLIDFVDPDDIGDNIHQIGTANFPTIQFNTLNATLADPFSPSNITNRRVFALTNLDYGIGSINGSGDFVDPDFVLILDTTTNCRFFSPYVTPDAPGLSITADAIPAGACDDASGIVDVTYEVNTLPAVIEVFRPNDDSVLVVPAMPVSTLTGSTRIEGLPVGELRVRVRETGTTNCNATDDFLIELADPLQEPLFSVATDICNNTVTLTATGNGGTPDYMFAVGTSFSDTSVPTTFNPTNIITVDATAFNNIGTGDIEIPLWVTDLNGCTEMVLVNVTAFEAITLNPNVDDVRGVNDCIVGQGPRIVLDNIAGWQGTPPYSYRVDLLGNVFVEITDITVPLEIPAFEGDFIVTITDSLGCLEPEFPVTVAPIAPLEVSADIIPLSCEQEASITLNITNATPDDVLNNAGNSIGTYSYQLLSIDGNPLNVPATTSDDPFASFTGITTAGLYEYRIFRSIDECETIVTRRIEEIEQIGIISDDSRLTCNADNTGEVSFEITDFGGNVINYTITDNATLTVAAGEIDLTAGTGTATTGAQPVVNLGRITVPGFNAGTFTLTLNAGTSTSTFCQAQATVLIDEPDPLTIQADILTALSCVNDSAIINATVEGGNGDYSYQLFRDAVPVANNDTGVFDQDIIEVTIDDDPNTGNNYVITVTDGEGCTEDSLPIFISHPISPEISNVVVNEIECNGDAGSFDVVLGNATLVTADNASIRYAVFVSDTSQPDNKGAQIVTPQANTIINNIPPGNYIVEAQDALGCISTFNVIMPDVEPVEFDDPILVAGVTCDPITAEYTLTATGGRPIAGAYIFQEYTDFISEGGVPIGTPFTGSTYTIMGNGQLFFRVIDNSSNNCDDFITFNAPEPPEQVEFTLSSTIDPLCFGDTGGFVDVVEGSVTGGVGNYVYNIYSGTNTTGVALSDTTTPSVIRVGISAFNNLQGGTYTYEVVSGTGQNACTATETFIIQELPELTLVAPIITEIGCPGDDDATASLMVTSPALNPFTTPPTPRGPFTYILAKDLVTVGLPIEVEDGTPAVFEFLSPCDDDVTPCYTYFVTDNSTGCTVTPVEGFNIAPKDPLSVILNEAISTPPVCKEDVNGTRVYDITGATPPYYYILSDNATDPIPTAEEVIAGGTQVLAVTNQISLDNLIGDTPYRLFVIDSGNGLTGNELVTCPISEFEFEFETEDLDLFDVVTTPNCDDGTYTVGIINLTNLPDEDLSIQLFERTELGTGAQITTVAIPDNTLALEEVPAGNYDVFIESVNGCTTTTPFRQILNLEEFDRVEFVNTDAGGGRVQPFVSTNEINVFQLLVTGGVNPNGINPYRFEGTFSALNSGVSAGIVEIDNDGRFTIEESGLYTFTVIDNFGDGEASCEDISNSIGINLIDIDIPNVFNPSSDASITNTWFPENLTSDFTNGISPIIGDGNPQIPGVVTTTNSTVTGGTTTDGTTTGGITTGGNVTGGSATTTVPSTTDGFGNTITLVTSGDFVIQTITSTSGTTSVTIFENAVVTGGVLVTNDETTTQTAISETTASGDTVFTITTGGTTTGGTTEGGITTGGTTTFINTSTFDDAPGSFVTTGGTTNDATTTGGNTTGGMTTVITIPIGGGEPTVTVSTGTSVTNGTTTGGTTTGGTTANGNVIDGISTTLEPIEFLDYENMEVIVFDRYGRQLDEFRGIRAKDGSNAEEGWDGTYQGKEMPSGDYWYLIKLNDREGREFTGHFTLYRRN